MKDDLGVHVLDKYPECLGRTEHLVVPHEIRRDCQLDSQGRPRDRLYVSRQLELQELVDVFVDCPAELGHADELTDLVGPKIAQTLPREVLLHYLFRHLAELS